MLSVTQNVPFDDVAVWMLSSRKPVPSLLASIRHNILSVSLAVRGSLLKMQHDKKSAKRPKESTTAPDRCTDIPDSEEYLVPITKGGKLRKSW